MTEGPTETNDRPEPTAEARFTVETLFRYLIGNASAIRTAAACPHLLWIGGLLVLSAGFAREYDGEDLLHEPWHLLIPHAASLATSLLLYCMAILPTAFWKGEWGQFKSGYRTFLGLFWLTAPCAWLYAIPVEQWMSTASATSWNLWMLCIVSVWRVALIIRVIGVIHGKTRTGTILFTVLFFGDLVMLTALWFVPVPLLQMMGGVRLTEAEGALQSTKFLLMLAGVPALVILGLVYLFAAAKPGVVKEIPTQPSHARASIRLWGLVAFGVLAWFFVLPFTQPVQQNRRVVDHAIANKDFATALDYLSAREPSDFPTHWTPPPQVAFPNQPCEVSEVMLAILDREVAPWVYEVYLAKFQRKLGDVIDFSSTYNGAKLNSYLYVLDRMDPEHWQDIEVWGGEPLNQALTRMAGEDGVDLNTNDGLTTENQSLIREILVKHGLPLPSDPQDDEEQPVP